MTTDSPFPGVFPHQHGDPRSLAERIRAQLRERLQEAVEVAGLELMVELRRHRGRPAPETSSDADRREFEQTVRDLLAHLRGALAATLDPAERADLERAEAEAPEPDRLLTGQVMLARRLPDYWQRFEAHRLTYVQARLETATPRSGWLARLFAGQR